MHVNVISKMASHRHALIDHINALKIFEITNKDKGLLFFSRTITDITVIWKSIEPPTKKFKIATFTSYCKNSLVNIASCFFIADLWSKKCFSLVLGENY